MAADSNIVGVADKANEIKRIMVKKQFFSEQPEKPFCATLLKDFIDFQNMYFVEPVAQAENYDDPVLAPYKAHCGELPLNEYSECDSRATQGIKWSKDPGMLRQQLIHFCRIYSGTKNFRVFELTFGNKKARKLVFYSERACGTAPNDKVKICGDGGYKVYNIQSCMPIDGVRTHDPYSYYWKRPLENYNGILVYLDQFYIFDLYNLDPSGKFTTDTPEYSLLLWAVGPDRSHSCSYSTIRPITQRPKQRK